jgi:hypothetical protein
MHSSIEVFISDCLVSEISCHRVTTLRMKRARKFNNSTTKHLNRMHSVPFENAQSVEYFCTLNQLNPSKSDGVVEDLVFCHVTSLYTHFDTYSLHISISMVEMVLYLRSLARRGTFSGLSLKVDDFQ